MKKRFLILLLIAVLMVSMLGVMTASAGASFTKSYSEVKAGKTYTFTVKVKASGIDMFGNVKCSGVFSGSSVQFKDEGSGASNESLSATVSIKVTVASSAKPGDTGTVSLSDAYYSYYDDSGNVKEKSLSGSKTAKVVTTTSKPATSSTKPTATPEPTEWELAANSVSEMAAGGTLELEISEDTKAPTDLLEGLKEKQGTLKLDFGDYSCTIDGSTLGDLPDADYLDLGLSLDVDADFSEAVDGADAYQLHFKHEGQFPCKISFTFKAESSAPGDTLYLYYYYGDADVIEGKAYATVDADGYVTFDVYHCSSYFVSEAVIAGAASNFEGENERLAQEQALADAEAANAELETELLETQTELQTVEAELAAQNESAAAAAEDQQNDQTLGLSVGGLFGTSLDLSPAALIAALVGIALLAMALTMLATRTGMFKRKQPVLVAAGGNLPSPAAESETAEEDLVVSAAETEPAEEDLLVSAAETEPAEEDLLVSAAETEPAEEDLIVSAAETEPAEEDLVVSATEAETAEEDPAATAEEEDNIYNL